MPAEVLRLCGLSVSYPRTPVIAEVDLTVGSGEMLALLGPSGSGKSTLLATIAGFHAPSAGEIWIGGRCVCTPARSVPPEQRDVAVVFQSHALWPHLRAVDTVAYPLRRRGERRSPAREQALRLLEQLGIAHLADRRPAELSGGEQQRVGLARALARQPAVYLFDEPTAHLDTHLRTVFLEELANRRAATGAAAVYATHDAEEALAIADRVALLAGGRLQQVGTPADVYARPVNAWVARMTGPASYLDDGDRGPIMLVRPEWARLGGDRTARLVQARFRGPHTDYLLETELGRLVVRAPGPPAHRPGAEVRWSLDHCWPLPDMDGTAGPSSSRAAGPE